ncbi:MAG TPA: TRAP transporter small permease [Vineibacter sp.]|nr:TRAP transporter small permease [Vineibacter sp.]
MAAKTPINAAAPAPLRLLLDGIDRLSRLDGWLGAGCLIALTLLMLAEVIVRALSNVFPWVPADIPVAWEYSSYLMAACFTFGAAMTLRAGGHIRVSLVLARLSPGPRRVLEGAAALVATIFVGFMAYAMVRFTWGSYTRGQTSISSDTALWIPQAVIAFGFFLLALQFLARTIQAALGLKLEDESMKVASVAE